MVDAADQTGDSYTFEKHVSKLKGGKGYADVWRRGFFAWEYKGKHKDLQAAYLRTILSSACMKTKQRISLDIS
jgi:hypothetical protein